MTVVVTCVCYLVPLVIAPDPVLGFVDTGHRYHNEYQASQEDDSREVAGHRLLDSVPSTGWMQHTVGNNRLAGSRPFARIRYNKTGNAQIASCRLGPAIGKMLPACQRQRGKQQVMIEQGSQARSSP